MAGSPWRIAKEAAAAAAAAASEEKAEQDREMDAMFEAAADVAASDASSPLGMRSRGRFEVGGDRAVALAIAEEEANSAAACCTLGSSTLDATEEGWQSSSEPGSFRHVSAGGKGEERSFSPNALQRRRDSAAASFPSGDSSPPNLCSMGSMGSMGSSGSLRNMKGILRRGSEEAIEHVGQLEPWTAVGGGAVQVGDPAMWQMPDQAEINVTGDAALVRAAKRLWRPPLPAQQEWWLSPAAGTGTYAPPPSRDVSPIKGGAVRSAREVAASLLDAHISAAVATAVAAAQRGGVERRVSLAESLAESTDSVERVSPLKAAQTKMEEEEEAQQRIQAAYQARAARKRVAAKAEAEGKVATPATMRGGGAQARKEMGEKAAARRVEARAQAEAEAEGKIGAELRKRSASKERLGRQTALGAQVLDAKSERSPSRSSMSSGTERADAMDTLAAGVRGRKARVEVRELRAAKTEAHKVAEVDEGGVERMKARLAEGKLLSAHEMKSQRNRVEAEEEQARHTIQAAARGRAGRKEAGAQKVEVKAAQGKLLSAPEVKGLATGVDADTRVKTEQGKLLSNPEVTRLRKECTEAERLAAPMVQKHIRGQQARKEARGKRHEEHHSGSSHGSPARAPPRSSGPPGSPQRAPPQRASPQRADAPACTRRESKDAHAHAHAKLAEQVDAEAEEIDRLWARQAEGKSLSMHEMHIVN